MPSSLRILADVNNAVASGTVTASSILPAENSAFRQQTARSGKGVVKLTGGYTGAADTVIDIEITTPATGNARASQPTFSGAGNGTITPPAVADGTAAQEFAVTLTDTGSSSQPARLALWADLALVAKTSGIGGNDIRVTVTPALTLGAALGATIIDLNQGATEWQNDRLDFGAVALDADGNIPASAPRIAFCDDPSRVYRHYKRWSDGHWLYAVTPALARDIPAGSSVRPVTGGYDTTISQGATIETYANKITLYSLLAALSASALVVVEGVIANDRQPGGQAVIDIPLRTDAWVQSITGTIEDLAATCDANLGNDRITLTCQGGGFNAERWTVTSGAVGALPDAVTGVPYANHVHFTIPGHSELESSQPIRIAGTSYAARGEGDAAPPQIGIKSATLGARATPKILTLTYKQRPDPACDIDSILPSGTVLPELLGLESTDVTTLDPELKSRLQALYGYREEFAVANSAIAPTPSTTAPKFKGVATKSGSAQRVAYFSTDLDAANWRRFHESDSWSVVLSATPVAIFDTIITRSPSTAYVVGQYTLVTLPVTGAQAWFQVTTAGTTSPSSTSPFYTGTIKPRTDVSDPFVDGSAKFEGSGPTSNYYVTTPNVRTWAAHTAYVSRWPNDGSDVVQVGGLYFWCTQSGTSGANTDPYYDWAFVTNTVTDGTVVWTKQASQPSGGGTLWTPLSGVAAGSYYKSATHPYYYVATTTGNTGQVEPAWGTADQLIDGGVTWGIVTNYQAQTFGMSGADLTFVDSVLGIMAQCLNKIYAISDGRTAWDTLWTSVQSDLDQIYKIGGPTEQVTYDASFLERYRAQCDSLLIDAGIQPGKFEAGSSGSMVWPDPGDNYWWEFDGSDYLPLFTNVIYHACRLSASGVPVSTQEFAFALVVACTGALKEGDQVRIVVGSEGAGYTTDDSAVIVIAGAAPLALAGGAVGTDTLIWSVVGSSLGTLPNYALGTSEDAYSGGGLSFTIHRGTIDFALGDSFAFAVTVGEQFKWRKDGGAWSADTAISDTVELGDGLSALFVAGKAPAFALGDVHTFQVLQPAAPGQVQGADLGYWQWVGGSATLTITWATAQTVAAVGLLQHALSGTATATIALKDVGGSTLATVPLTVRTSPLVAFLDAALTGVRSMTVTLTNATGMQVGWVYAGVPWASVCPPDRCVLRRVYALNRNTSGVNPRGAYLGAGRGGEIAWNNWLMASDWTSLQALVDDCKRGGDKPIVIVPNTADMHEAALVVIDTDLLEISDEYQFQDPTARQMSLTLPLAAVVQ